VVVRPSSPRHPRSRSSAATAAMRSSGTPGAGAAARAPSGPCSAIRTSAQVAPSDTSSPARAATVRWKRWRSSSVVARASARSTTASELGASGAARLSSSPVLVRRRGPQRVLGQQPGHREAEQRDPPPPPRTPASGRRRRLAGTPSAPRRAAARPSRR
jgi:hypothetical protein